jgi:hypothetical protein
MFVLDEHQRRCRARKHIHQFSRSQAPRERNERDTRESTGEERDDMIGRVAGDSGDPILRAVSGPPEAR